jgi:glutamate synthase (NADPH) small chain
MTKKFIGANGVVKKLLCVKVEFERTAPNLCPVMREVPGSAFEIDADLVILAIGFVHPEHAGLIADLGLELDQRGNVLSDQHYKTSRAGVFTAGDMRRGQSLVVWAIHEGRKTAHFIDHYLMGYSNLPVV